MVNWQCTCIVPHDLFIGVKNNYLFGIADLNSSVHYYSFYAVIIIVIIITKTMCMVLSSWQNHCESSPFTVTRYVKINCLLAKYYHKMWGLGKHLEACRVYLTLEVLIVSTPIPYKIPLGNNSLSKITITSLSHTSLELIEKLHRAKRQSAASVMVRVMVRVRP